MKDLSYAGVETAPPVSRHSPTLTAIRAAWALFVGLALIMLANGLQGTLLGLRASLEGFATTVTGMVMSAYFLGFMAGSSLTPGMVRRVGHIRVFAALASLASIAILVHGVFVNASTWFGMRTVTGFCYAGMYVVAESWLNDRASNEIRGRILSIYMVVMGAGMGSGQLLLNLSDPRGMELFVLTSVLVSLALVPILLTARPAPAFAISHPVSLRELARISPLGFFCAVATGIAHGSFFGMGAVYGRNIGLSVAEISWFMAAALLGGICLQWPIGRLSDRFDRRRVLTVVSLLAAVFALAAMITANHMLALLLVLIGLFGGMSLPLYSLAIAHTNDRLAPEQILGASAALVLVSGIGLVLGPVTASILMTVIGPAGLLALAAAAHAGAFVFALYRMTRRPALPAAEQAPYVATAPRGSVVSVALAAETAHEQQHAEH